MYNPVMDCLICDRIKLWTAGNNPYFVHEYKNSILVVGDHQFHRGYCLLLLKNHVRELHELPPEIQQTQFAELMDAGRALVATFAPWKMNYACYGNAEEHVHWHIFPRYDTEPDHRNNPWLHASEFGTKLITPDQARTLADRIRVKL